MRDHNLAPSKHPCINGKRPRTQERDCPGHGYCQRYCKLGFLQVRRRRGKPRKRNSRRPQSHQHAGRWGQKSKQEQSADPERDFLTVRSELAAFDPMLSARPALIALNKLDLVDAERASETARAMASLAAEHTIESVFVISAEQRSGLDPLVAAMARLLGLGGIEAQCPR